MEQADGAPGDSVVLVVECCQDPRQVTKRRDLVGQLALSAEQTNCCSCNCLQGVTLWKGWKTKILVRDYRLRNVEKNLKQDAHIGIIFLKQLSHCLQEGNQELSRFTQHPTRLCDEDAKEDSTNFKLILSSTISYCEVLWNLSA